MLMVCVWRRDYPLGHIWQPVLQDQTIKLHSSCTSHCTFSKFTNKSVEIVWLCLSRRWLAMDSITNLWTWKCLYLRMGMWNSWRSIHRLVWTFLCTLVKSLIRAQWKHCWKLVKGSTLVYIPVANGHHAFWGVISTTGSGAAKEFLDFGYPGIVPLVQPNDVVDGSAEAGGILINWPKCAW